MQVLLWHKVWEISWLHLLAQGRYRFLSLLQGFVVVWFFCCWMVGLVFSTKNTKQNKTNGTGYCVHYINQYILLLQDWRFGNLFSTTLWSVLHFYLFKLRQLTLESECSTLPKSVTSKRLVVFSPTIAIERGDKTHISLLISDASFVETYKAEKNQAVGLLGIKHGKMFHPK